MKPPSGRETVTSISPCPQGAFLTDNSDKSTVARNSGFFYAMLQGSMLVGNLFAYFQFRGLDSIDRVTRLQTIGGLFASTVAGCLLFILLLPRTNLQ